MSVRAHTRGAHAKGLKRKAVNFAHVNALSRSASFQQRPFLLNDPDSLWVIYLGRLDIFAVPLQNGQISGARTYLFSVEEKSVTLPRLSTTAMAKGYRLYPYFGGDETAPHDVRIWIKEE